MKLRILNYCYTFSCFHLTKICHNRSCSQSLPLTLHETTKDRHVMLIRHYGIWIRISYLHMIVTKKIASNSMGTRPDVTFEKRYFVICCCALFCWLVTDFKNGDNGSV